MNKEDIIFKIGTIRREAHLSARALSLKIDKNDSYINRLETQKDFLPTMEGFLKILEECGYTAEKFFYHDSKSFEADMEIVELFKNLPQDKKEAILKLIK